MYKTIVVDIDGSEPQGSRLAAAALLANEHGAHLIGSAATGVSWMEYAVLTGSMGLPIPYPTAQFEEFRNIAAARLEQFSHGVAQLGVSSFETQLIEDNVRNALLLQSRYADLVVLSQDGKASPGDPEPAVAAGVHRLPEYVAMHGPRPVLVVPESYHNEPIPGTAVVGWDGGMAAIRVIAAALPLLRRAESVKLVVINPDELSDLHGEQPGADMALYLARQNVRVDVVVERTAAAAGDALISLAAAYGAGLMVAGVYGHSRYREWVVGGVTRELLKRTRVPLLVAH